MKKGGSKKKGRAFEATISKQLSMFVSNNQHDDLFIPSVLSGGVATRNHSKKKCGDISSTCGWGEELTSKYYFELKAYKNIELEKLLFGQDGFCSTIVMDTFEKAMLFKKKPVCIFKQDRKPIIVITEKNFWDLITDDPHPQSYQILKIENIKFEFFLWDDLINSDYKK